MISYHRTDSTTLSDKALRESARSIRGMYGEAFYGGPRQYQTKVKNAQEAHEAIRPTDFDQTPQSLSLPPDEARLYDLIWKRTVASQMADARLLRTTLEITATGADGRPHVFTATGKAIQFAGFLRAYVEGSDDPAGELGDQESLLPKLSVGDRVTAPGQGPLTLAGLDPKAHETLPPPRYTDASLVKRLEEDGIGRPSTYASIIQTIERRGYVWRQGKALIPSYTAFAVTHLLKDHFGQLVELGFTGRVEEDLDQVSNGELDRTTFLEHFYNGEDGWPGLRHLVTNEDRIDYPVIDLGIDPTTGQKVVIRIGRYGAYAQMGDANASIPDDVAPADFTVEQALKLLKDRTQGPQSLGADPKTGLPVYMLTGRFGPYVQLGEAPEKGSKEKPRRASLTKNDHPDTLTLARALELLSLPRLVGHDAEAGQDIIANFGRFGPYVKRGDEFRSLGADAEVFGVTLEQAIELFKQEKKGRRRTASPHRAARGRPPSCVAGEDRDPRGTIRPVRDRWHHQRVGAQGCPGRCRDPRGGRRPAQGSRRGAHEEGPRARARERRRPQGGPSRPEAPGQAIGVNSVTPVVTIIGGGLAGCEAAWQVASRGVRVRLHEMRPVRPTLVHQGDSLAELVCSNSFRGDKLDNAVGVLKEEMRRLGSIIMRCADATRVPAGAALAVDRGQFAAAVTAAIGAHPLIEVVREEVTAIPAAADAGGPVIIATGPLTSDALSQDIARFVGAEHLSFYDAISPIVLAESIDRSIVFRASRWGRSLRGDARVAARLERAGSRSRAQPRRPSAEGPACGVDDGEGDYLNCPMSEEEYRAFYDALVTAESATVHDFDKAQFFEGCLPIEVMAHRGRDTLRFGPMKPVGLPDPRTGRIPFAVVQLRQDTLAGDHFSLVGFQTQLKWGEQARVLRMIPGLAHRRVRAVRDGAPQHVHQRARGAPAHMADPCAATTCSSPVRCQASRATWSRRAPGLLAGINAARQAMGEAPTEAPRETAIGALAHYVSHAEAKHYQPTNITFGIMPPLLEPPRGGRASTGRAEQEGVAQRGPGRAGAAGARPLDGHGRARRGAGVRPAAGRQRGSHDRVLDVDSPLREAIRAFRDHLALNRNASAAHRPQLRSGPRAVPLLPRRVHGHAAPRADAGARHGRRDPRIPRRTARPWQQSRLGGAPGLGDSQFRALPPS